jgi:hypothetical protein
MQQSTPPGLSPRADCCSAKGAEAEVAKAQRTLDGATRRFNDFERADARRTEESKAARAKAKKLRTKRDKDAAALQVWPSVAQAPMCV